MLGQSIRQSIIPIGNETFDKFLGGGFLNSSLNLFERQGPSSTLLDAIWNKSLASSTLTTKSNLIYVNFNSLSEVQTDQFLSSLPVPRKVKSEMLFKDIRGKSQNAKIKIAWRYSSAVPSSPSDNIMRMDQIDFGLSLVKETEPHNIGQIKIINIKNDFNQQAFFSNLEQEITELKKLSNQPINIIIKDLLHPFSPMIDDAQQLCGFMYTLRCVARTLDKGVILVSFDTDMCPDHANIKQHLYNVSDCVVSFYTYETGQNRLVGYKNTDGTLDYVKVPKINSFGLHFQRELSDWGFRLTKNHRFFVIDELSLPPCGDDEDEEDKMKRKKASELTAIEHTSRPLRQVGPLEDFKEIACDVLAKQL